MSACVTNPASQSTIWTPSLWYYVGSTLTQLAAPALFAVEETTSKRRVTLTYLFASPAAPVAQVRWAHVCTSSGGQIVNDASRPLTLTVYATA